jgi:hypothetical protein
MGKKKRRTAKKQQQRKKLARPVLKVDDAVRVKDGVMDPDYEEQCIGGWTGTITDIDRSTSPPLVLITWDEKTLTELIGAEVLARADRHGLRGDCMWLDLTDIERLELAQGTQPPQPARLDTRLHEGHGEPVAEADLRIAQIFGLSESEELPDVTEATLESYHQYLCTHLRFPFEGEYSRETGPLQDTSYVMKVTGLADMEDCDEFYGLLCEGRQEGRQSRRRVVVPLAEIEVGSEDSNFQLIDDYRGWFWNYR